MAKKGIKLILLRYRGAAEYGKISLKKPVYNAIFSD
jgi:hypothetical protein